MAKRSSYAYKSTIFGNLKEGDKFKVKPSRKTALSVKTPPSRLKNPRSSIEVGTFNAINTNGGVREFSDNEHVYKIVE